MGSHSCGSLRQPAGAAGRATARTARAPAGPAGAAAPAATHALPPTALPVAALAPALPQIVAEDAAASEVLEADEFDAATQDSLHYAREIVTKAVDSAATKVG